MNLNQLNSSLPQSSSFPEGQADIINSPVAIPTIISSSTGHARGHTSTDTNSGRSHIPSSGTGISDATGMPKPGCMAYLRESFSSRVSPEASKFLLSSWRPKTQSSYNSAFTKWASCVSKGTEIPLLAL